MGNIVGSNIYNILLILGINCVISPFDYNVAFNRELVLLLVATTSLLLFAGARNHHIGRKQGIVLLVIYIAYVIYTSYI